MNSYAETILANSVAAQRSQFGLLMLMAIAGAQRTNGQATLSGGESHPHGLQRFLLQHWQLYTLILDPIELHLNFVARRHTNASDSEILLDKAEWDAVGETANLIEELRIVELEPLVPLLREIRGRRVAD